MTLDDSSEEQRLIEEAWQKRDWQKYALLHDDFDKPKAILRLLQNPDVEPNSVWPLIGLIWCTSSVEEDNENWVAVWAETRGDKTFAMDGEERAYLNAKKNEFNVWQGGLQV